MTDRNTAPDLWPLVHRVADAARVETLRHFRSGGMDVESKGDAFDPVTIADREAEAAMRALIARERPGDAVLGEEHADRDGSSGLTWILDPIDGTRGFISGTPTWGVLIAVADADGPFLGVIDQPYIGERFMGGGGVARLSGPQGDSPLAVRRCEGLAQATLFTTFPEIGSSDEADAFGRVAAGVRLTRYGCDCYAYALLALGQIDLVIEAGLQAFDVAAPIAVIEAAGGIVTDWTGGPAWHGGRVVAAGDPRVHEAALRLLNA